MSMDTGMNDEDAEEVVRKSPGAATSSSSATAPAPAPVSAVIDWEAYDQYMCVDEKNSRYTLVKKDGETSGVIQQLVHEGVYRAFALCKCKTHSGRCSRSRGWKQNYSEVPQHVDRVLAHWLFQANEFASTRDHMAAKRF